MIFEGENVDVQTYMRIYTSIHNFCCRAQHPAQLLGEDLYIRLSAYLKQAVSIIHKGAEKLTKEQLLDYYNAQWNKFIACSRFNHYLWKYLHTHWITRELGEGHRVDSIFDLHLREWKLVMLDTMHENLAEILLGLIRRQRDGEQLEQLPRKSFINSISKCACTTSVIKCSHAISSDSKKV